MTNDRTTLLAIAERIADAENRITRLRNYFYNVELLVDLAGELELPVRSNGHRWWRDAEANS